MSVKYYRSVEFIKKNGEYSGNLKVPERKNEQVECD
jgi:hypothetical protein